MKSSILFSDRIMAHHLVYNMSKLLTYILISLPVEKIMVSQRVLKRILNVRLVIAMKLLKLL